MNKNKNEKGPTIYQFGCLKFVAEEVGIDVADKAMRKMFPNRQARSLKAVEVNRYLKYMSFKYGLELTRFE